MVKVVSIELNELDFALLQGYARDGSLPTFQRLLSTHDLIPTIAETDATHLEPWIQWITVHTGLTFAQHGVFRLGDIVDTDLPQVWEILEERFGLHVGAISPMNARNRLRHPAFFVSDPWTRTPTTGTWDLKLLAEAVAQAVNDNAHGRITFGSYCRLAAGALVNVGAANLPTYAKLAASSRTKKWRKALLLDLLLGDAFIRQWQRTKPDYASLFLNAGAHIQHHYMFSSRHYRGPLANPSWYVEHSVDPVGEVYAIYDRILHNFLTRLPDVRLLLCTGLSQQPNVRVIHYYRPKDHGALLQALGVCDVVGIEPRMSRDFLVVFASDAAARAAQLQLESFRAPDGSGVFSVENRGRTLFCMLAYTSLIEAPFSISGSGCVVSEFETMVSHVSIENAVHRSQGYFLDTGLPRSGSATAVPLKNVFMHTLGIWDTSREKQDTNLKKEIGS